MGLLCCREEIANLGPEMKSLELGEEIEAAPSPHCQAFLPLGPSFIYLEYLALPLSKY